VSKGNNDDQSGHDATKSNLNNAKVSTGSLKSTGKSAKKRRSGVVEDESGEADEEDEVDDLIRAVADLLHLIG
jgi:hypothetical protein